MKKRVMITGANGFTGLHACHYFQKEGYEVIAVSRNLNTKVLDERICLEKCDLTDKNQVKKLIQKTKPDRLLHLAGQNQVQESWLNPLSSLEANAISTAYIIDAIRQENLPCKIIVVGSALQFKVDDILSLPHPYSLSKTIQVLIAQSWEALYGMDIIIAKPTNLIGPGLSNGVCSILAKKVAEMEIQVNEEKVLTVNNLYAQRDFIDVRDAVRAYEKIFQCGHPGGVYDISSGEARYLKDITDSLQALSNVKFNVQTLDNTREKIEVIKPTMLLEQGWKPVISFNKSMEDILHYQRNLLLYPLF